ncbi:MAG TPA: glycosyltransferase family 4 protein [Terriglobales bacterium]|nr:glycosyltransferase family 4 protein [Terriglobales bacterium]
MKILFVTHFFPYPPDCGGRIGCLNPIRYLSRNNEVVLVSLGNEGDRAYVPDLEKYCDSVHLLTVPRWRRQVRLFRGLIADPPGSAAKFFDPRFGRLIRHCVKTYGIDIVELQHLNTAAYLPFAAGSPVLLREHNVEYKVWDRHAEHASGRVERRYVRSCARRVRAYEARMAVRFARCVTVSRADAGYLKAVAPEAKVATIPSGVDCEYFFPCQGPEDPFSMVLTGSFEWRPKQHNLLVMLERIFPRIRDRVPAATLTVVGSGVPPELRRLGERIAGVRLTGAVPDVREYVRRASLVLNYLESGGGIALKVLEAMAMRKPVLSNSLGMEGIGVEPGRDACIADGIDGFADAAAMLLLGAEIRARFGQCGYELVRRQYCWSSLARRFEELYSEVTTEWANRAPLADPAAADQFGGPVPQPMGGLN